MSQTSVTTHDLFMKLGSNVRVRSVRADAVFRRLRLEQSEAPPPPVTVEDAAENAAPALKREKPRLKNAEKTGVANADAR